jgi:amino acid adenylation domain-containing protein
VDAAAAASAVQGAADEVVVFPLSFPQQRLWLLDRMEPGSPAYNVPVALRRRGALRPDVLRRALCEIVARHESLRTRFALVDGEPAQLVVPSVPFGLPVHDLSALPAAAREDEARRLLAAEARTPFDLGRAPLLRARLLRLAPDEHLLLLTLHHVVSDGWSMGVLHREMDALYRAFAAGASSPLPPLPIQYGDYAVWQREELTGEALEEQLAFWRAELAGAPPAIDLPFDRPRPPVREGRGARHVSVLPAGTAERLAALGRAEGATPFMTLLAACGALLGRHSGAEGVVVGTPVAGRTQEELEGLIGFFVNTLAVRVDLGGDPTFAELVARVRGRLLGAYAHQDVPFDRVVEALRAPRDPGRTPVFQVMFVLQGAADAAPAAAEAAGWTPEATSTGTAKFDLSFAFAERPDGGVEFVLDYDAALFDPPTMERMAGHLRILLDAAAADPRRRLSELPLLPADEARRLLAMSRGPAPASPAEPVHRCFVAQARRTPSAPAAIFPDAALTYGELERRSARVARRLRAAGVGPEVRVALVVERTPEVLAALLGILRAGGAYVPLDPDAPAERAGFVLRDSGARILLAREPGGFPGFEGRVLPLEMDEGDGDGMDVDAEVERDSLAYVIYTSGSTGTPKGVMVPHGALARLTRTAVELHGLGPGNQSFCAPPLSFDGAAVELFPALASGASLLFHPAPGSLSGREMLRFLERHGADGLGASVALWRHWLDDLEAGASGGVLPLPSRACVGGEGLPQEAARAWRRLGGGRTRVFNYYGPTETTVIVTARAADEGEQRATVSGTVPIGGPLPGTAAYVLDGRLRPVPLGVAGELFVGGAQVARGYLGRPAATADAFLPDPFTGQPGARLYRTGDRVRRLPDGALEFLGRLDDQVKVRGFRVEPAEVEAALLAHPAVRDAAVVVRDGPAGEPRLVGYAATPAGTEGAELRDYLRARLPDYMVPAAVVVLDALPLTSNGKVDRRALPEPPEDRPRHVPPRTATERAVAAVWEEVLGVERIGVGDDFFALGGHSLAAARAAARVRERLGRDLPLAELFRGGTVERVARFLDGGAGPDLPPSLVRLREGAGVPLFCVHAAGGAAAAYLRLARLLDERAVYGVEARGLAPGEDPSASVEEMAGRYLAAVRAVRPHGPYLLAGWSVGGVVAFEMARRLRAAGEEVALLALIDSWAPVEGHRPEEPDEADLLLLLAADLGVRADPAALAGMHGELRRLPPDARLARFHAWARDAGAGMAELDADEVRRRLAVYRATARAVARYTAPGPYGGRVALFRASRSSAWPDGDLSPAAWEGDPRLGWRALSTLALEVHPVEGTHQSIVLGADVGALAEALRSALAG